MPPNAQSWSAAIPTSKKVRYDDAPAGFMASFMFLYSREILVETVIFADRFSVPLFIILLKSNLWHSLLFNILCVYVGSMHALMIVNTFDIIILLNSTKNAVSDQGLTVLLPIRRKLVICDL